MKSGTTILFAGRKILGTPATTTCMHTPLHAVVIDRIEALELSAKQTHCREYH